MELKSVKEERRGANVTSFNRTFMELKLIKGVDNCVHYLVLIVPLWN